MRTPRESVRTSAPGSPAASALIPSAPRRTPAETPRGPCRSVSPASRVSPVCSRSGDVGRRPHRGEAALVGIGGQDPLQQPHRGDAVHQRVVHLGVHRDAPVTQPLDQVHLPQRPLQGQPGAVQPAAQLEQLADPAGLRERAVPEVVLQVEVLVLGPEPLAGRGHRAVRALEEQRSRLLVGQHLLVEVLDEVPSRPLGLVEQLEAADVHRLAPALREQEPGRRRIHRCRHRRPFGWWGGAGVSVPTSSVRQASSTAPTGLASAAAAQPTAGCSLVRCRSQSRSVRIRA